MPINVTVPSSIPRVGSVIVEPGKGLQGPAGKDAPKWSGVYDYTKTYVKDSIVSYLGSSYISLSDTSSVPTNTAYWELLAAKGTQGVPGPMPDMATVEETIAGLVGNKAVTPEDLASALGRTHVQLTPSDTWSISHGLNRYPAVAVIDSAGTIVEGNVTYVDLNNIIITFNGGFAGSAYLS